MVIAPGITSTAADLRLRFWRDKFCGPCIPEWERSSETDLIGSRRPCPHVKDRYRGSETALDIGSGCADPEDE